MTITSDQLSSIYTSASDDKIQEYIDPLNDTMDQYNISDNPQRSAAFLAQIGVESGYFSEIIENLNYSAQGLLNTFPSHFTSDEVNDYARQPEKIANRVYANRMGNGDESSGDGWNFRGRGLIQITGRDNYQALSNDLGQDFINQPDLLAQPEWAVKSAGWFWNKNSLNALADSNSFETITKRINGGTIGETNRETVWNEAKTVLGC